MNAAEPRELGLFQSRNGAEDAHLFAMLQLGLEADHVEQRAELVVLAKLHDGIGLHRRIVRVGEAERLHRPVAQRLAPALRHHLDRQAAVEIGRRRFPVVERDLVAREQCVDEGRVLLARQRAIDVVGAGAAGAGLVVARLKPGDRHVDRVAMHDRRDGIEEGERVFAGEAADDIGERRRGEGAGRDDDAVPVVRRGARLPRGRSSISGCASSCAVTAAAKPSRSTASAPPAGTWFASPQRMISEPSRRISSCSRPTALVSRSSERNELEQTSSASACVLCAAVVRVGPHLVQHHRYAAARDLPCSFAAGEPAADDVDRLHSQGGHLKLTPCQPNESRSLRRVAEARENGTGAVRARIAGHCRATGVRLSGSRDRARLRHRQDARIPLSAGAGSGAADRVPRLRLRLPNADPAAAKRHRATPASSSKARKAGVDERQRARRHDGVVRETRGGRGRDRRGEGAGRAWTRGRPVAVRLSRQDHATPSACC